MNETQQGQASSSLLIIEDNAAQLKTLGDILKTEGLQPVGCSSGREALEACQQYDVHVAILDLRLPDMDGLEVLAQLKRHIPDIKVIINTAHATLESAMEAVNKEAYAYVQKMGDVEELLAHVHRAFHAHLEERTAELSRTNAELARAIRLKDEFLANMSHEFRTPLNVILGMSESLQEEVYGALTARQLKSLRMIEDSGRHLLTLITDILDLSKIGAGKLELEIALVFVESICRASLQLTKQIAQKKRLKVSSMFDSSITRIQADGRRLKQILVNLLSNAIKFTPESGEIGLEIEGDPEQGAVHFTVWDTGIGIARKDMERLFQPFVQLDASLSRKYEGAGLGLSLVYRMTEMHGGSVSVESEVGKGSRFTVSLPWQESGDEERGRKGDGEFGRKGEQRDSSPSPHPPISPSPQSVTILIAEDNEATITTLSGYLTAKGYQLLVARNGWEAFAYTKEHQPDLIVMDIQMPDMGGLEAIRHIRADKQGHTIPIIALTALAMPGDREECLAAGADEYLSKPVNLKILYKIMGNLLDK